MDEEHGAVPITPELFKGLKRRTYRRQRGYTDEEYLSVPERVVRTGETLSHVERLLPGVSDGHIVYRLARLVAEHDPPVDVAMDDEHGVCVAPNPFKVKPSVDGTVEADKGDDNEDEGVAS